MPKLVDADRDAAWDINVRGTMNICSKLKKGQRLVFMSSAHVYNRSIQTPHKEDEIPAPKNFYGFTKSVGEDAIRFYAAEKGLSYVIFRLFNSYSKDQRAGLIIGDVIEKYRKNDTIEMFDPDSELDMVHIDDVITILQDADTLEQGTYNLCTGKPIKIREIYLRIKKYLGMDKKKETVVSDRKQKLLGDGSKLRSIGFKFREFSLD